MQSSWRLFPSRVVVVLIAVAAVGGRWTIAESDASAPSVVVPNGDLSRNNDIDLDLPQHSEEEDENDQRTWERFMTWTDEFWDEAGLSDDFWKIQPLKGPLMSARDWAEYQDYYCTHDHLHASVSMFHWEFLWNDDDEDSRQGWSDAGGQWILRDKEPFYRLHTMVAYWSLCARQDVPVADFLSDRILSLFRVVLKLLALPSDEEHNKAHDFYPLAHAAQSLLYHLTELSSYNQHMLAMHGMNTLVAMVARPEQQDEVFHNNNLWLIAGLVRDICAPRHAVWNGTCTYEWDGQNGHLMLLHPSSRQLVSDVSWVRTHVHKQQEEADSKNEGEGRRQLLSLVASWVCENSHDDDQESLLDEHAFLERQVAALSILDGLSLDPWIREWMEDEADILLCLCTLANAPNATVGDLARSIAATKYRRSFPCVSALDEENDGTLVLACIDDMFVCLESGESCSDYSHATAEECEEEGASFHPNEIVTASQACCYCDGGRIIHEVVWRDNEDDNDFSSEDLTLEANESQSVDPNIGDEL